MGGTEGTSYIYGPLVAFAIIGLLVIILRWAFGHGKSLIPGPARRGPPTDYGLLVEIAAPKTTADAQAIARRLGDAGVTATIAPTTAGPRVMVWPQDEDRARTILGV